MNLPAEQFTVPSIASSLRLLPKLCHYETSFKLIVTIVIISTTYILAITSIDADSIIDKCNKIQQMLQSFGRMHHLDHCPIHHLRGGVRTVPSRPLDVPFTGCPLPPSPPSPPCHLYGSISSSRFHPPPPPTWGAPCLRSMILPSV